MDNRTLTEPRGDTATLAPTVHRERPLARVQTLPWLLFVGMLALAAWLAWRAFFYQEEGDPVGSAMLAFEKQNSLTVFSSRFEVVAESVNTPTVGPIPITALRTRQAAIIPAVVEYKLDLSAVDRESFAWQPDSKVMTVTLPQLQTGRPNLDEAEARIFKDGIFTTGDAAIELGRNNSRQAERKAATFARNPEVLALARNAAREAIRQNLAIPLQVAGYGDVEVEVRFDGEAVPAR